MTLVVRTNLPDFSREIARMGTEFGPVVARAATRAAAQVIRREAVRRAPRRTGRLARAIYIKRSRDSTRGREHYFIGVRQGRRAQAIRRRGKTINLDAYYWRFLEGGWIPRGRGQAFRGGRRARALARARALISGVRLVSYPFLGPAFEATRGQALTRFYEVAEQRVAKWQQRAAA